MPFSLLAPASPDEAVRLLMEPGTPTAVLAGGTDLLFDLVGPTSAVQRVLSLRRLGWNRLSWTDSALTIGSTAPLSTIESDPRVRAKFPGLYSAIRAVGGVALRHRATIGGNLGRASPASDLIPVLLALDSTVLLLGPAGHRSLSVPSLIRGPRATTLGPGELIESVTLPEPRPSSYVWQRVRRVNDISQVGVAAAWSPSARQWAVAVGGAWPAPARLGSVEAMLEGPRPSLDSIGAAAEEAAVTAPFVSDKRASAEYRRRVLSVLIRRAVAETTAESSR